MDTIDSLLSPASYRMRRQHLFESDESLVWFRRRHRAALNEAGALLQIAGRVLVDPERFDQVVLEVALKAARERKRRNLPRGARPEVSA